VAGSPLPSPLYSPFGGLVLTMLVAFLVLTACGFLFASAKGSWVKTRLAPHVEGTRKQRKRQKGERLAALAGLCYLTLLLPYGGTPLTLSIAALMIVCE